MPKKLITLIVLASTTAFATPVLAAAEDPVPTASATTSSNGSSTGVGNAGSFGIGSGTSDSLSTSIATSNGVQDSSTKNTVDNHLSISTLSTQDLQASNTSNFVTFGAGANPALQTGSASASGNAIANYSGILNNGWNTAPAGIAQAATNIAVNGNLNGR